MEGIFQILGDLNLARLGILFYFDLNLIPKTFADLLTDLLEHGKQMVGSTHADQRTPVRHTLDRSFDFGALIPKISSTSNGMLT